MVAEEETEVSLEADVAAVPTEAADLHLAPIEVGANARILKGPEENDDAEDNRKTVKAIQAVLVINPVIYRNQEQPVVFACIFYIFTNFPTSFIFIYLCSLISENSSTCRCYFSLCHCFYSLF